MLRADRTVPEPTDVIRESLAGLVRNIAAFRRTPFERKACETVVHEALGRLELHEITLLREGHPQAIARAAQEIGRLFEEVDAYGEAISRKLRLGQPLDLVDLINDAITSVAAKREGKKPLKLHGAWEVERIARNAAQDPPRGIYVQKTLNGGTNTIHHRGTLLHRDPAEGPAVTITGPAGRPLRVMYLREGILHRPSSDGPACIEYDAEGRVVFEAYVEDGQFHRDPALGPSLHDINPAFETTEYVVRGVPHRDWRDGPAIIIRWPDGAVREEYIVHDVCHRPSDEGPALLHTGPTGRIIREAYLVNGKRHRDPKLGPACRTLVAEEGRERFEYFVDGLLHREEEEGPALLEFNAAGDCLFEGYFERGRLHRDPKLGPACRTLFAEEGHERLEYVVDGLLHREEAEGPAWIGTSLRTGRTVEEGYYRHGEPHRQDGPATIIRNDEGTLLSESWFRNGVLDRDPAEGPAITIRDEDGSISIAEFYRAGELAGPPPSDAAAEEASCE